MRKRFVWLLCCCLALGVVKAQTPSALYVVANMIDSINSIKTLRFKVVALERTNGVYVKAVSENKINTKPRKIYLLNPEKKLEILYVAGEHNGKAIVKPHVFPYITLQLNPLGSLMRRNQHYSIHELGFDFIGKSIALALSKERDNFSKCITNLGIRDRNGYKCYMLWYEAKTFPFVEYTVQPNETVTSIALKLNANDYLLRAKNNLYNEFDFLEPGTKLLVPKYYCKKAILYIDQKTLLPVSVNIFDDFGLLESYDFSNIIVNKPFAADEFNKDYKDYHF